MPQVLCYECGKKLYQNRVYTTLINNFDPNFKRKFHKSCAEEALRTEPKLWRKLEDGNNLLPKQIDNPNDEAPALSAPQCY